MDTDIIVE